MLKTHRRMRLVAIETARFSGAGQERVFKLDWDLVSGEHLVAQGRIGASALDGDEYLYAAPQRSKRPTDVVYIEDTPDPVALLDAAQRGTATGRD